MARIDQETVNRILDATDIVDVVSDFVKLKRRGANYIGLCPFHNERTPSFSVSKAKGFCKCFSCGKGGSAVSFLMELEQLSYVEALKYLAKKYNIEIKEHELSDAEREAISERESLLATNQFAQTVFEENLTQDPDGIAIGLSYFRERGINEQAIKKFHLGYALDSRDAFYKKAIQQGYNEKYLLDTGLCSKNERGIVYDKFRGRVIYPVFSVSGKVVAFGGRTLRNDKTVAKYVNSPESIIYSKSNELYGLYQAKQSIVRLNKCYLVEGYMDVISMAQTGIENVVASSGTSLTDGQIRLIHRFTENVTVIYDSDPAGIKASLRGIDMLLSEGMKIKVLLLPEGEDPDSFSQSHTLEEIEHYIQENETDFIRFKTRILLEGAENDPIKRSQVISDIVKSIACIPDNIARAVYIGECSRLLEIDEKVLKLEVDKKSAGSQNITSDPKHISQTSTWNSSPTTKQTVPRDNDTARKLLALCERELLRYVLKYGMKILCDAVDEQGNSSPMLLIEFVYEELSLDNLKWSVPVYARTFDEAVKYWTQFWASDKANFDEDIDHLVNEFNARGFEDIKATAVDMSDIKKQEALLAARSKEYRKELEIEFTETYLEKRLASSPDDGIRELTIELVSEKHQLSKVHTKYTKIETERDKLVEYVPKAIAGVKDAHLALMIKEERDRLSTLSPESPDYAAQIQNCMTNINNYTFMRKELARDMGERVIIPRQ
ncbi:MAG: DNA primase [Muribaculaceae bacterium]|nr:DNA primase [Muribaculaceae bacterium]